MKIALFVIEGLFMFIGSIVIWGLGALFVNWMTEYPPAAVIGMVIGIIVTMICWITDTIMADSAVIEE